MDEARASCAVDISGRGAAARLRRRCRRARSATSTTSWPRSSSGRWPRNAKLTLHLDGRGGHQRPPHDRGGVQGVRAGAARRGGARPDRGRRAEHQGDARVSASARRDRGRRLRDGQPALGREGARARRRARARSRATTTSSARRTGWSCPAWARSRRRCTTCASSGSTSVLASARGAGVPVLGICLGMQLLFERSEELERDRRPRAARRRGAPLDAGGLRMPHIGWNEVAFRAGLAAHRRPARRTAAPSTTCTRWRPAPARPRGRDRHRRVRRAVRHARRARATSSACSSTPRSPRAHGLALLRNFAALCAARARRRSAAARA